MDRACKIELDSDTVRSFASKFGQILTSVFLNSLLVSLQKKTTQTRIFQQMLTLNSFLLRRIHVYNI